MVSARPSRSPSTSPSSPNASAPSSRRNARTSETDAGPSPPSPTDSHRAPAEVDPGQRAGSPTSCLPVLLISRSPLNSRVRSAAVPPLLSPLRRRGEKESLPHPLWSAVIFTALAFLYGNGNEGRRRKRRQPKRRGSPHPKGGEGR